MAETTFGRAALNDGKLVSRLRDGGRITTQTLARLRDFMSRGTAASGLLKPPGAPGLPAAAEDPQRNFRFFDNRQKYLLFVNTCSEKWVVASRVTMELQNIHPRPPAVRVFDAGVGDGTVLSRVLRAMHQRYPTMPFYVVGKEISLEDVRLALHRMADRFFEHPATTLVLTNLAYADAPLLAVRSRSAASSLVWHELRLTGNSSYEFEEQIIGLEPFLVANWKARVSERSGNPIYERPVMLVIYRDDHRFLLDSILPRPGGTRADFDLVIASQPYRARAPLEFKASRVIAPLARALGPGGRLIGIHSHGNDPGAEIVQSVWPDDNPFLTNRHDLLKAVKAELGADARLLNFNAYSDERALFRYHMHTLPSEVAGSIGTSTLFAAWNAAIYVSQVEDDRLTKVIGNNDYLEATAAVLHRHDGLWFNDESYVISRRRD
jgi:SAM-dependent methyltransferase